MTEKIQLAINFIILVFTLLPIVIHLVKYLGVVTKNKSLETLSEQATTIVKAIEQLGILGSANKRDMATRQLTEIAKSLGITLSANQISAFIEQAVFNMNAETKKETETPEEESTTKQLSLFEEGK